MAINIFYISIAIVKITDVNNTCHCFACKFTKFYDQKIMAWTVRV